MMTRKLLIVGVFLSMLQISFCQGWEWKINMSYSGIVKDMQENLYVLSQGNSQLTIKKFQSTSALLSTKIIVGSLTVKAYKVLQNNNLLIAADIYSTVVADTYTLNPIGNKSFCLIEISPSSTTVWAKVYSSDNETLVGDLFICSNGDYMIGGSYDKNLQIGTQTLVGDAAVNIFIAKFDVQHNLIWVETSASASNGGTFSLDDIAQTNQGNYYMTVTTVSGLIDFKGYQTPQSGQYLFRLDANRTVLWAKYINYPSLSEDSFSDLQVCSDTAYLKNRHAAKQSGISNEIHSWDHLGSKKARGIGINAQNLGYRVDDNKLFYASTLNNTMNSYMVEKIGSLTSRFGPVISARDSVLDTVSVHYTSFFDVQVIDNQFLYISGSVNSTGPFVGKYNFSKPIALTENFLNANVKIFPNPCDGYLNVTMTDGINLLTHFEVRNQLGQLLLDYHPQADGLHSRLDLNYLPKGFYFVTIQDGIHTNLTKSIVIQ